MTREEFREWFKNWIVGRAGAPSMDRHPTGEQVAEMMDKGGWARNFWDGEKFIPMPSPDLNN